MWNKFCHSQKIVFPKLDKQVRTSSAKQWRSYYGAGRSLAHPPTTFFFFLDYCLQIFWSVLVIKKKNSTIIKKLEQIFAFHLAPTLISGSDTARNQNRVENRETNLQGFGIYFSKSFRTCLSAVTGARGASVAKAFLSWVSISLSISPFSSIFSL